LNKSRGIANLDDTFMLNDSNTTLHKRVLLNLLIVVYVHGQTLSPNLMVYWNLSWFYKMLSRVIWWY